MTTKKANKRKTETGDSTTEVAIKKKKSKSIAGDKPTQVKTEQTEVKKEKAGKENKKSGEVLKDKKKKKDLDAKKVEKKANLKAKVKGGPITKDDKKVKKEIPKDKKGQREQQKKLKAERKKKKAGDDEGKNELFELGVQAKQVWETVRSSQTSKEEKEKLIPELHSLLKGNVEKVIRAHDTVRVIEFLMAEGTPEIREDLYQELKDQIVELSKSKYAAFFVLKLLNYGSKEQKAHILKSFEGKVAEMTKHKIANTVIEACYNEVATAPQRNRFLQEFLGPEFRLWKHEEIRTVLELVARHPEKEKGITLALGDHVSNLITKGCFNLSMVHTVLYNYMLLLNKQISRKQEMVQGTDYQMDFKSRAERSRSELISQLREACVHIVHTHDGARLAMNCLWHGSAKDRKSIVKSFKTLVTKVCTEEHGHVVMLAAFDAVDDTKLMAKAIVGEMVDNLDEIVKDEYGKKVIMYLAAGRDRTFFHPDYLGLLTPGDGNEHSKKDAEVKRKELAVAIQEPLCKYVVDTCLEAILNCLVLLDQKDQKFGSNAVFLRALLNSDLMDASAVRSLHQKLAEVAARPFEPGQGKLMEHTAFHQLIKKVISHDKERVKREDPSTFCQLFLKEIEKQDSLESLLSCNRGAFVLVIMLEAEVEQVATDLKAALKKSEQQMAKFKSKGIAILAKKIG